MADEYGFKQIARIVREASDVKAGVKELYERAGKKVPAKMSVWRVLSSLDWEKDVPVVAEAWRERARTCIPSQTNGIYLGLDGLNMPAGKGVELGCSMKHVAGADDVNFVFECDTYCDDLPMPSLAKFYTWFYGEDGHATFEGRLSALHVEYPICLGVTAVVIRDALKGLDADSLFGKAKERSFAFGFHDGDMMRLGRATSKGFDCDASFDCW